MNFDLSRWLPWCAHDRRHHWFCLSFLGSRAGASSASETSYASVYMGWSSRLITVARINEAKEKAGVKDTAVLLSASYLGHMSRATIDGRLPEIDAAHATEPSGS